MYTMLSLTQVLRVRKERLENGREGGRQRYFCVRFIKQVLKTKKKACSEVNHSVLLQ